MKKLVLHALLLLSFAIHAQEKDRFLPEANAQFAEKNYADAEANYRISQSKFSKNTTAAYNLGNSIYNQKQSLEAGQAYLKAIADAKTRPEKHKAYHNLGNVFMNAKDYMNAVNAFRNALVNDPTDEETRYNFALAKELLKKNPPKNNDKNKDKNKDKKDDKNNDKKDDKGNNDKDKDKDKKDGDKNKDKGKPDDKSDKKAQPKPQEGGISKQRLENLLDAINNEEKKIQEKVNKNKVKGRPVRTEKDW